MQPLVLKALDLTSAEGTWRIWERIKAREIKMLMLDVAMTPPTTPKSASLLSWELVQQRCTRGELDIDNGQ